MLPALNLGTVVIEFRPGQQLELHAKATLATEVDRRFDVVAIAQEDAVHYALRFAGRNGSRLQV
ncbi:MAG: hypothetical protein EA382_05825 [Spirochaetaceae bacterium]|nr:MAG: hypothetical protein EA382_05825 [Spirochaetaceae bacterium]